MVYAVKLNYGLKNFYLTEVSMLPQYKILFLYCDATLNNSSSKEYIVISCVPQGSKLAPIVYILYANDIAKICKFTKVKMYADDLTIYVVTNNNEDKNKF